MCRLLRSLFFFFNDTATTEIYTLSLHDALPISGSTGSASGRIETRSAAKLYCAVRSAPRVPALCTVLPDLRKPLPVRDRKSTRLNSSHVRISYAVFCLKKKKQQHDTTKSDTTES